MGKQASTRWASTTAAAVIGTGLTVVLLLLIGGGTGDVMAAPPAGDPRAPLLDPAVGITVVKTAPATVYQALGAGPTSISYTLAIQNPSGHTIIPGSIVYDALPAGTTLLGGTTGADWSGVFPENGAMVTYTLEMTRSNSPIDVGGYQASLAVPVRDGSVFINSTYCFSGTVNGAPRVFCDSGPVATTVRAPDFGLSETPSLPVCAGGRVTYTLAVTNPGGVRTTLPYTITGAITSVLNMIPSTISDGGTWSPYTITWNVASNDLLANGANQVVRTYAVTVPAGTAHGTLLTNTYVVASPEVLPNVTSWQSTGVMVTRPTAAFTTSAPACANNEVAFQNLSLGTTSYVWDFGDSSPTSTEVNPTHVYATYGTYTVTLTASGNCGTAVTTQTVQVYPSPSPVLQIAPDPTQLGVTTYFTDTGSLGAFWDWDFGDGSSASTFLPNTSHVYTGLPGMCTVVLTSTSGPGCLGVVTRPLQVNPGAPYNVSVSAWPLEPLVGTSSAVTATVTDQWGNAVVDGTTINFTANPPPAVIAPPSDPTSGGQAHATVTSTLAGPVTIRATAPNSVFGTGVVTFMPGAPYALTLAVSPLVLPAGSGAALTATVVDIYSNPIPGQVVTFTYSGGLGGGSLTPQIATADGSGEAHATIVSTLPGPKVVTATAAVGVWDSVVVTFTAGTPYTITLVANPMTLTVGNSAALTATVTDQFGNAIAGEPITFSTTSGLGLGGGFTPPTDSTDGAGQAHSSVRSTDAGLKTIRATASNSISGTVVLNFRAGPPMLVSVTAVPDVQTVGSSSQLQAMVWDQYLNAVPGEVITFTSAGLGSGSVSPITATTDFWGLAYSSIMSTLPGPKVVTATASNLINSTTVVTFVVGTPYTLTLQALPTTLQVGNDATLTATLTDRYGNPLPGYTVGFTTTAPLGLGGLAPLSGSTDGAGQTTSALSSTLPGVVTVIASQGGLMATADVTFTVGSPANVVLVAAPDTLPVGSTAALTATVTDQYGNPISGRIVGFASSMGNVWPPTNLTDGAGRATSSISSTVAGQAVVTATDTWSAIYGTALVTFTGGTPANLTLVADPVNQGLGGTSVLTATLLDAFNNPVVGYTINFATTSPLGAGGLWPLSDSTDAAGEATSAISSTVAGVKTITATYGGLVATAQVTFSVGTLTTIVVTPNPATVTVGSTQVFNATGYDQFSNPMAITPLWTTNGGTAGAGPSATTVFTAQTTPATGRLITATQGAISGVAVINIVPGSAVTIDLTPPASTIAAGQTQGYIVTARDVYNNPWDVTALSAFAITPGAGGTWTTNVYTGEFAGTWTVTATYLSLSDTAVLTVAHAPTAASAVLSPDPYSVGAGGQVIYTLIATDAYGNAWDATASGTYTITPAAGGSWAANVYTTQYTGTWTVTATVPSAVATATLTVTQLPVASFIRNPAGNVMVAATIQFTDTSLGGPTQWLWDFGDGITSMLQHPTHAYTTTGTFTVTLTVTNTYGSDSVTGTVTVIAGCVGASITSLTSNSPVDLGQTMFFTATVAGDTPITYTWDFGDSTAPATGVGLGTISHIYGSVGTFTVTLTVTNACGADSDFLVVTVNCVPVTGADFTWFPASPATTETVTFTGTVAGGSPPVSYEWEWGDGTPNGTGNPAFHTFTVSGTYNVVMTATNGCGVVTATHAITSTGAPFTPTYGVELAPPTAAQSGPPGSVVTYTLTVTNTGNVADSYDVTWSVGGQVWTTAVVPTQTATLPPGGATLLVVTVSIPGTAVSGQQSIATITATSVLSPAFSDSSVLTTTVSVTCTPPSVISLSSDSPVDLGQVMNFLATVTGDTPITYTWDFGDSTAPVIGVGLATISHTYASTGTFTVVLTVTNACGMDTDSLIVSVTEPGPPGDIFLPIVMREYPPPPPRIILVADPVALLVGETAVLTATAVDTDGLPVPGVVVTFSTGDPLGAGSITPGAATTNGSGQAVSTVSSTVVGLVWVTAGASGYTADSIPIYFRSATFCAPQLIAVAETGPSPREVALDTAGHRAFVAHFNGVTVIDSDSFAVLAEIDTPAVAHGIAYDFERDRIWVAVRTSPGRVAVLDGGTYATLAELPAGNLPHSVAFNPTNDRVYVTNFGSDTVRVYRASGMTLDRILSGFDEPAHIGVNPVTNKIYVANHGLNGGVTVIRGGSHNCQRILTALIDPYGVAVDTTRNLVYVTAILQARMMVIDGATDTQLAGWDILRGDGTKLRMRVLAVNPDAGANGRLFVVNSSADKGGRDQLVLFSEGYPDPDLGTAVPLDLLSFPQEGIAFDPDTDRVWVTSVRSGVVSVVQDGDPLCDIPLPMGGDENSGGEGFDIEGLPAPEGESGALPPACGDGAMGRDPGRTVGSGLMCATLPLTEGPLVRSHGRAAGPGRQRPGGGRSPPA